jgi:hypothetical protein
MDYARLRNELLTDSLNLGYKITAVLPGVYITTGFTDEQASIKLNALDTGRTRKRPDVSPAEIWQVIDMADLPSLSSNPNASQLSQERRDLTWLTGLATIPSVRLLNDDGTDTFIRTNLARLFPAGTGSRTRLLALGSMPISRATELELGFVSPGDVTLAREKAGGW